MVGRQVLALVIMVRIHVSEPSKKTTRVAFFDL